MAVAEALARGLPVVSTTTGAIPAIWLDSDGRCSSCRPAISRALTAALSRVIGDPCCARASLRALPPRPRVGCRPGMRPPRRMADERSHRRSSRLTMADFSAEWLALREPADHAARSDRAHARVARRAAARSTAAHPRSGGRHRVEPALPDGAGPTPRCRGARLAARRSRSGCCSRVCAEIAGRRRRAAWICRRSTIAPSSTAATLVTASALLDLVSGAWLRALADALPRSGAAVLFALTYDGRIACSPEDPDDAAIVALVNRHQRTDKGFGPALGPDATDVRRRAVRALGYRVQRARERLDADRRQSARAAASADRRLGAGGRRDRAGAQAA